MGLKSVGVTGSMRWRFPLATCLPRGYSAGLICCRLAGRDCFLVRPGPGRSYEEAKVAPVDDGTRCKGRDELGFEEFLVADVELVCGLGCTGVAAVVTGAPDVGVVGVGVACKGVVCWGVAGDGGTESSPPAPGSTSTSTVSTATLLSGFSSGIVWVGGAAAGEGGGEGDESFATPSPEKEQCIH